MSPFNSLREKVFHGYKRKDVTVDWWSGRQTADLGEVLKTTAAKRLIDKRGGDRPASSESQGKKK